MGSHVTFEFDGVKRQRNTLIATSVKAVVGRDLDRKAVSSKLQQLAKTVVKLGEGEEYEFRECSLLFVLLRTLTSDGRGAGSRGQEGPGQRQSARSTAMGSYSETQPSRQTTARSLSHLGGYLLVLFAICEHVFPTLSRV